MNRPLRAFAILPAAGVSRRMGVPKLLLPWRGKTIMEHVLDTWTASCVDRVVIVVRHDDTDLAELCGNYPVDVITPLVAPSDMKASVRCALEHLASCYHPAPHDAWLLAPADMPRLTSDVINTLVAEFCRHGSADVLIPTYQQRRGHPLIATWACSQRIAQLGPQQGIRDMLKDLGVAELAVAESGVVQDIDDRNDYQQLLNRDK